ncbi:MULTISPECIES: hypothetical protein [unclassified Streptomyces]|uniref:hypothetical protein n=1 Tax=unclassified Streptomyces TaxID=2593676 RepID=UPI0006AF6721|nr:MULTISPECIES: hypothetical protein [unclassified Streptomyces]
MMVATSMTAQNVLVPRFGPRPIVPLGMALVAAAIAWLTALDLTSTYAAHDTASWRSAAFFAAGLLITVILYRSGPLSAQTAATRAVPAGEEESGNAPVKPGR